MSKTPLRFFAVFVFALTIACASPPNPYETPDWPTVRSQLIMDPNAPQIEEGQPILLLDGLNDYVFSLPTKLMLWNRNVLDHKFPEDVRESLEQYIELNHLRGVKVRHNQYAPWSELKRLYRNKDMGILYRVTVGSFVWLRYTIFPDRLFGGFPIIGAGDHFSPFTNSIHIFSSDQAIVLHEAGHAKDYMKSRLKGARASLRLLPGVDLFQEATATSDTIRYLHCMGQREAEVHAYRTLIPAYSTYIAGYIPGGLILTAPVVAFAHLTGRMQANTRQHIMMEIDTGAAPLPWEYRNWPSYCAPLPGPTQLSEAQPR